MTGRTGFALGIAYGLSLGMALKGLMDYGEALAGYLKRPTIKPTIGRLHP